MFWLSCVNNGDLLMIAGNVLQVVVAFKSLWVYIHIYIYIYVCMFVCMYMYFFFLFIFSYVFHFMVNSWLTGINIFENVVFP